MNKDRFESVVHDATREITERHPKYFAHFGVDVASIEALAHEYASRSLPSAYSQNDLENALSAGLRFLTDCGTSVRTGVAGDAISRLMVDSIVDAFAAARGEINLGAADWQTSPAYANPLRETPTGVKYIASRDTGRALLVISSTGIPLRIWSRLLDDRTLDRRVIMVQSRGGSLIAGGVPGQTSLQQDVANIVEAARAEGLAELDVVAWCNGSRVALELARQSPSLVASLLFIAPTFHGAVNAAAYPSPFEDSLARIRDMLERNPGRGEFFLRCMNQVASPPDLHELKEHVEKRVESVLNLPPYSIANDLVRPFATVEFFRNYVDRMDGDVAYDTHAAIAAIRCPVFLLTGTHDTAINTKASRDSLSHCGSKVVHLTLHGAGHHIHWLQYGYFRYVLDCLLAGDRPMITARLAVEDLAA